jgi:CBS domain containing-hemolysin-like protein
MSESLWGVIWLVVLLAGNAFFVGAEFAVLSARRAQIEPRAADGSRAARMTLWAMEHATLMLAAAQLGITICSLLILGVAEPAVHHLLEAPLAVVGLPPAAVTWTAFGLALVMVTLLHVVLGEMVPKNLAFATPARTALVLAPALVVLSALLAPVIWAMNGLADLVLRTLGVRPVREAESAFTLEQVEMIVAESRGEGTLDDAAGVVTAVFTLTGLVVGDVATPLDRLVTASDDVTPAGLRALLGSTGHSRIPLVPADTPGRPPGAGWDHEAGRAPMAYVHVKDLLPGAACDTPDEHAPLPVELRRTLPEVAGDTPADLAVEALRGCGAHLARVTGGRPAVVFLADLIELLVGEVQDVAAGGRLSRGR